MFLLPVLFFVFFQFSIVELIQNTQHIHANPSILVVYNPVMLNTSIQLTKLTGLCLEMGSLGCSGVTLPGTEFSLIVVFAISK